MNEILAELYLNRGSTSASAISTAPLPKRLLAQTMALTEQGVRAAVQRQLQDDLKHVGEVLAGRKHVLELVNVQVLEGVPEQVAAQLSEVSGFVADTILSRCLVDLTNELLRNN